MTDLRAEMRACTACPLHESSTQRVPIVGSGRIVVVGEAPGKQEDTLGVPFMGPAGSLLDDGLVAAGMSRGEVATMNTIGCRPRDNMYANAEDAGAPDICTALWFKRQLNESRAWIVVLAGAIPLRIVSKFLVAAGAHPPKGTITTLRGKPFWHDGRVYIPTFHPSYALRMGGLPKDIGQKIVMDLRLAKSLRDRDDIAMADDYGAMVPVLTGTKPKSIPADMYSAVLGHDISIVNSLDDPADHPKWTVAELARLAADPCDIGTLHTIAAVKSLIDCEIV